VRERERERDREGERETDELLKFLSFCLFHFDITNNAANIKWLEMKKKTCSLATCQNIERGK
jgi:hypothetical protein